MITGREEPFAPDSGTVRFAIEHACTIDRHPARSITRIRLECPVHAPGTASISTLNITVGAEDLTSTTEKQTGYQKRDS